MKYTSLTREKGCAEGFHCRKGARGVEIGSFSDVAIASDCDLRVRSPVPHSLTSWTAPRGQFVSMESNAQETSAVASQT